MLGAGNADVALPVLGDSGVSFLELEDDFAPFFPEDASRGSLLPGAPTVRDEDRLVVPEAFVFRACLNGAGLAGAAGWVPLLSAMAGRVPMLGS